MRAEPPTAMPPQKLDKTQVLLRNLPQLQNLIKRDSESYREEFCQQWQHYESGLAIFEEAPGEERAEFGELVAFMSHVAPCYPREAKEFPRQLSDILARHYGVLQPELRRTMVAALSLLRNRGLVASMDVLPLFFTLLRCRDKALRTRLCAFIISDVRNANARHRNNKLNRALQNYMVAMLRDPQETAARQALKIMLELFRKGIWDDPHTANMIAEAALSDCSGLAGAALAFLLDGAAGTRVLHLLHDPQGYAERLFSRIRASVSSGALRFETRLLALNVISRLIGLHKLVLLDLYAFLLPYLQPHQRDVTTVLAVAAQASHELVPPADLAPVLQTIADKFIWGNGAAEVVVAGYNAVRLICERCPLAMDADMLRGLLLEGRNYKNKAVGMAVRALQHFYQKVNPELLARKDRGKEASMALQAGQVRVAQYGESAVATAVDVEALAQRHKDIYLQGDSSAVNDSGSASGSDSCSASGSDDDESEIGSEIESEIESGSENSGENSAEELNPATVPKLANADEPVESESQSETDSDEGPEEFVDPATLLAGLKRTEHHKEARMASIMEGREGRLRFGSRKGVHKKIEKGASLTNAEKAKRNKAFMMISKKRSVVGKSKRSLSEKRRILTAHAKRQKMKRR